MLRPRWVHVRTGEPGYSCRALVARGVVCATVERFWYGCYGTVFGRRTGNLGADPKRAKRIVLRRTVRSEDGVARLLRVLERPKA